MRCKNCEGAGRFGHCHDPECMVPDELCDDCRGEGQVCDDCQNPLEERPGEMNGLCADCATFAEEAG